MTPEERREYNKKYREQNKEKICARKKERYRQNKEEVLAKQKEYYKQNKEKIAAKKKKYAERNKEKAAEYSKEYRKQNKEKLAKDKKEYYEQNKEKVATRQKEYYEQNKEKVVIRRSEYRKLKSREDPTFKFMNACRKRIWRCFKSKGLKKMKRTFEILGCTPMELRDHLQSQFTDGMTLENHGEWHIDHIIPLASANTEEEIIKLCHYTNLQPLWAEENMSKGDKIIN